MPNVRFLTALSLTATALCAFAAPLAAKAPLAPHRAAYDMKLVRAGASTGITSLTGRMVFELKGNDCKGYTQSMRFVTATRNQSGQPSISDQRSTFFEDALKHRFRFQTDEFTNDKLSSQSRGQARRKSDGGGLSVSIAKPKPQKLTFKRSVVFPVEHSLRLLEAAKSGQRLYSADLYDGSEKGAKVYETTAALGDRLPPGSNKELPKVDGAEQLDGLVAWPVSLSYFEINDKREDAVPTYELSFLYFENGVSRKLTIDYGTFAMSGRLVKLILLPQEPCRK